MADVPAGNGADENVQKMMEEDNVNEREPTASSTLSKEARTEMGKLLKVMAPVCLICVVAF